MAIPKPALSRREFIFLVAGLMMVDALAVDIMLPALPNIGAAFDVLRENDRSLVITAFLFGFGLPQIVFGPLTDRFGRRSLILGGMVAYLVTTLAAIVAPSFTALLIFRFVQGVAGAAVRVALTASVRDLYVGREMARIMSLVFSIFLLVPVVMPALGQVVLLVGPWQWIFVVMGAVAAFFTVWAFIRLRETLAVADRRPLSFRGVAEGFVIVLTSRRAFFNGIVGGFQFGAVMGIVLTGPQIFGEQFGWGPYYPIAMTFFGGSAAICSLLASRVIGAFGLRRSAHGASILLLVLSWFAVIVAVTVGLNAYAYLAIVTCFSLPLVLGFSGSGALSMEPLGAVAGTASAVFGLITTLTGAWLSYVIAQSYNGSVTPILIGVGIMAICVFGCYYIAESGRLFGRDPDGTKLDVEPVAAL
jgi:DHA1 family bicyclomycin/chloramphenicol resistance-like MFS transporter